MEKDKKEKIVNAVVEQIKLDSLYEDLLKEKVPEKSEEKFRKFLDVNKIKETKEIQKVWKDLKTKKLFTNIFAYPGVEGVWQKMKKDFGLKGWVFRS